MTGTSVWSSDWPARVLERVRALGHSSVSDYLSHHPAEPYVNVAQRLGDVAAVQLRRIQRLEIRNQNEFRRAAMDCMAREITAHLPQGWGVPTERPQVPPESIWKLLGAKGPLVQDELADRVAFQTSGVYADWMTLLREYEANIEQRADAVWVALKELSPPIGWLPAGPDDPIIVAAFDKGWPLDRRHQLQRQSYGLLCPTCTAVLTSPIENVNVIDCPNCHEQIDLI